MADSQQLTAHNHVRYHGLGARCAVILTGSMVEQTGRNLMEIRLIQHFRLVAFLFAVVSLAAAQAPSAPGKPLPPGPMQAKVKAICTQCHNATRITEQHMTRQQWAQQLKKMEGLGAVIPEPDRSGILTYLTKNFGPANSGAQATAKKPAE